MTQLIIENVGPIKEAKLDLNKINVFMGPQSSGKSTIAKIISYCHWVEKNYCLSRNKQDIKSKFRKLLEEYHNIQGYIKDNSSISYQSKFIKIECLGKKNTVKIELLKPKTYFEDFKRPKILYIPAERNFVSALPNWNTLKLPTNNLRDFMTEWGEARNFYNKQQLLNLKPLNISYYANKDVDFISVGSDGNEKEYIRLGSSSSGVQSLLPLYLLCNTYLKEHEGLKKISSNEDLVTLYYIYNKFIRYNTTVRYKDTPRESDYFRYKGKYCVVKPGTIDASKKILDNFTETQYIQSVIEEPELNLFPDTQQKLIYELIENIVENENQITITTHSPFILFAINNCMLGGLVDKNIDSIEKDSFPSKNSWIDPNLVSIYEIHNGELRKIQDEDNLLEDNYINKSYQANVNEYLSLLNYYDDEE